MPRIQRTTSGTKLWLSADDTYRWARRPGHAWPGSTLSGRRVFAEFDADGDLIDYSIDGNSGNDDGVDMDSSEFDAITSDYLEPATDVIFRVFTGKDGGDVIALFPGLAGTNDIVTCQAYQHTGQHSSASLAGCIDISRPAGAEEYADLQKELERIGYRLRIVKRSTDRHRRQRRKQIDRSAT